MYKNVLYNIKKMKKWGGGEGEGNILTQNTLYVFKKEKDKKVQKIKIDRAGIRTHDLRV